MEASAQSSTTSYPQVISFLENSRNFKIFAVVMALGLAGVCGGVWLFVKPIRAMNEIRYQAHEGLMRLYTMQTAYRAAHGTFANDIDTLLASSPDGAQLREKLKTLVDLNTLTVVGNETRFKLEINILDGKRTPVKLSGTISDMAAATPTFTDAPRSSPPVNKTKQKLAILAGLLLASAGVGFWQFSRKPKSA